MHCLSTHTTPCHAMLRFVVCFNSIVTHAQQGAAAQPSNSEQHSTTQSSLQTQHEHNSRRWARAHPNKDRESSHAGHQRTTCSRRPGNQTHFKATGNNDLEHQKFLAQNISKHTTTHKTQSVAVFVPTKQKQVTNCNKQCHQQGEGSNVPQNEAHSVQHRVP